MSEDIEKVSKLEAWCHWRLLEEDLSEDDLSFAKSIKSLIEENRKMQAENKKLRKEAITQTTKQVYLESIKLKAENKKLRIFVNSMSDNCNFTFTEKDAHIVLKLARQCLKELEGGE